MVSPPKEGAMADILLKDYQKNKSLGSYQAGALDDPMARQ